MSLKIQSFSASGGFFKDALKGEAIKFADGLTVIVGGIGSGKTAIIETIGFAFGLEPSRVWLREKRGEVRLYNLPRAVLGAGTARCEVEEDGDTFALERHVDAHIPRVIRGDDVAAWTPQFRDRIEVYSSGEIQQMAADPLCRLAWLDRAHRSEIDSLSNELRAVGARYQRLGPEHRRLAEERNDERDLERIEQLRSKVRELEKARPTPPREVAAEQERFRKRWEGFYQFKAALRQRPKSFAALLRFTGLDEIFSKVAGSERVLEPLQAVADEMGDKGAADRAHELAPDISELRRTLEDEDRDYRALQERVCPELMESILEQDRLALEISRLERDFKRRKEACEAIEKERARLLAYGEEIAAEIFATRRARATELNEQLKGFYGSSSRAVACE